MKKVLIFLAVILLAGTGYFTYIKWYKGAALTVWSFVPASSVLVYETSEPLAVLPAIAETDSWKNLAFVPAIGQLPSQLSMLDTLVAKNQFSSLFANTPCLIAANVTSSQDFGFLFIVEIENLTQQTFISKALNQLADQQVSRKTRQYLDFTITDLTPADNSTTFTYIYYKNFFIGSFSAVLVEDAVRAIGDTEQPNFQQTNSELQLLTKLERDQGNLYVNLNRLTTAIHMFSTSTSQHQLAKSAFLDLKIDQQTISLNGFTFVDEPTHFLSTFQASSGGTFDMAEILPNETAILYHMSNEEPFKFGEALARYFHIASPEVLALRQKMQQELDFDVTYVFGLIDQEIGLVTLESGQKAQPDQLLILEIADMDEALRFFNGVDERYASQNADTVYVDAYGDYEIRRLPVADFPEALVGRLGAGFGVTYYLPFRNYLIFSNSIQQLKNFTIAIENESTWVKSIRINRFLTQINREASFSFMVNTPRVWQQTQATLKPVWQEFFGENQFTFKNFEFAAAQFSTVDNKFYTNLTFYLPELPKRSVPDQIDISETLTLPDLIISKPWLVTNHTDRSRELIVQDTSFKVYQVGADFNVQWSKSVDGPIVGAVQQIDYYKNGKLQVVFATPDAVHVIDRTGEYLPEFPVKIAGAETIQYFSLIDYNKTKDYRYALADKRGNIFLTDKNGKALEGWNPKKTDKPLVQPLRHYRVSNRDFLIGARTDGRIVVWNRRGDALDGFPLDLGTDLADELFVKQANDVKNSTLTALTTGGELIEMAFNSRLIHREQLYKPATATTFSILESVGGNDYLILRKTGNQHEILDKTGKVLFSKDYLSPQPVFVQFYQLGAGQELVAVTEPAAGRLYLYNLQGNLVTGKPLDATQPVSLMQLDGAFHLYRSNGRNLELVQISY